MKPDITTPNTLLIGLYVMDGKAVALGTINAAPLTKAPATDANLVQDAWEGQGEPAEYYVRTDALRTAGTPWEALAEALAEADVIAADCIAILTNDPAILHALTRFTVPAAAKTETVKLPYDYMAKRQDVVTVKTAWDPHHTTVLQKLGMRGGRWSITLANALPKARKEWEATWQ